MESVYLVLTGITVGSAATAAGSLLGAFLVKKTYSVITEPPELVLNLNENAEDNSRGLPGEAGAYDWDSYDKYVNHDDEEEDVPAA